MGRYRGLLVVVLAALVVAALLAVPTAPANPRSPLPGIPGIPGIPNIPSLPKPDQKAVFDVVVEGTATDTNTSELSGRDATCLVTQRGRVEEKDTYLRGRGVQIEFARYGREIIVKRNRGGQLGDLSLAVKVTVHRTASGGATYTPAGTAPCNVAPTDISKDKDCGRNIDVPGSAMLLSYQGRKVGLEVSRKTKLKSFQIDGCGEDPTTGVSDQVWWAWPNPIELKVGGFIAPSEIFNRRVHAIVRTLLASDAQKLPKHEVQAHYGPLMGTVTDLGSNKATIRLIRVRG